MYPSLAKFPGDLFAEFDAIHRQVQRLFGLNDWSAGWTSSAAAGFPALNMGSTADAVEIYAFAPGLDPARIDVSVEKGYLVISGERTSDMPTGTAGTSFYMQERFFGSFRRVVRLPEDVDPSRVEATYRNGVLKILIPKLAGKKLRKVEVKELEHKH